MLVSAVESSVRYVYDNLISLGNKCVIHLHSGRHCGRWWGRDREEEKIKMRYSDYIISDDQMTVDIECTVQQSSS